MPYAGGGATSSSDSLVLERIKVLSLLDAAYSTQLNRYVLKTGNVPHPDCSHLAETRSLSVLAVNAASSRALFCGCMYAWCVMHLADTS